MDMWFSRVLLNVRSQLNRLTHEFCGSEYVSLAIGCGRTDTNLAGARWCQTLAKKWSLLLNCTSNRPM